MGRYEVTQQQWKAVLGANPSYFSRCGDDCPVETVSWDEAQAYVEKLSQMTGKRYRLPSEAEWEYAARAGTSTPFHTGQTITTNQANFNGNFTYNGSAKGEYKEGPVPVGTFASNQFGLFDLHGNIWEWLQDSWHDDYVGAPSDGSAWTKDGDPSRRVFRGGSWSIYPRALRSAERLRYLPDHQASSIGLRVARDR
jgi:formylglycine-generating enzyme required for sulfatase activity